ncbi:Gfo/Idh/MocA family protein [Roseiflexus castenholzii]|jgi:predicted dehydrogenase|uniref:Oxidoreductase domain protein n=1 Tax=Roseiflexus castenholzii (strain DSM 13941 / HLO8) TaxID=383372 RepID=A7NLX4_ROSCS|nr:Gfo/Idh/MocA family oxidoreductase [Roseiflexus castenholzii]ABU58522.1 oxidoreductase domain protein [Roseiflexus castenholzii DSM 13941]
MPSETVRFAAIGLNHAHIYGQTNLLVRAGAELVAFYAAEPDLAAQYGRTYPQATQVSDPRAILEDPSIHLIISAAIPDERAPLGIAAMRHGKDYMADKPGFTTLAQLDEARRVQAETGRIYSICFSERFENAATVRAGELARSGAIGTVVQTIGLGPHRVNLTARPPWFFQRSRFGGIINDIGSHQADQFLFFTGATRADVVTAQVANYRHPQYPEFDDFGDVLLRGVTPEGLEVSGYIRVDWHTPDGLGTWGDGRLIVLGTEGYIEVRKNIDIAGRPGGNHLFLVDQKGTHCVDCSDVALPYGPSLVYDILHRTETAMPQEHCFLASELVLRAEAAAHRLK